MLRSGAHNKLGQSGEDQAAEFLVSKGYVLLEHNLVFKQGEIDLLMMDGEVVVLVEVKTKKKADFADPIYQITPAKQRKLRLLGSIIAARYPDKQIRIDAVTVVTEKPTITHLQNILF